MILPAAATGLSVVMLAGLLWSEATKSRKGRYLTKPLASLGFILVCITGASLATDAPYPLWILAGLVFGAGGDVALMFEGERAFLAGLVSFLLGHIAYVVAFAAVLPPADWATPVAVVPVAGALAVGAYLWPHLGSMKLPVVVYILVITAMAAGALAIWLPLLTAGAIAFFVSDVAVARDKFVAPGFSNRAWGLPAYYGGQLLLAWSTFAG